MSFRILICDPLSESGLQVLQADPTIVCDIKIKQSPGQLKAILGDYDAVIVRSETKLTADVLKCGTRLKVVGRAGSGVDNIDVAAAKTLGIRVLNVPAGTTIGVAELTLLLMLTLARPVIKASASLKAGEWKRAQFIGTELFGKRLGIVGYGRIGQAVAARAKAFGMDIVASPDPNLDVSLADTNMQSVSWEELLKTSDYISLHLPFNPGTKKIIGAPELAMMKKGVKIVNCARGGLIDEGSLHQALVSGQVAAAAIDVFEQEPPPHPPPLVSLPNVIAIPHLGASSHESQARVGETIAKDVLSALHEILG